MDEAKNKWAEELPIVLRAYYTTPRASTNETSFNLVFSTEAVIPIEVGLPNMRIEHYDS